MTLQLPEPTQVAEVRIACRQHTGGTELNTFVACSDVSNWIGVDGINNFLYQILL